MKKNYFLIALLAPLTVAMAQLYVGDNVKVYNKANTLIYVDGDMTMADGAVNTDEDAGTTASNLFSNNGNVNVRGVFTNNDVEGDNFVNRWVDPATDDYGQLIINAASAQAIGNITQERILYSGFSYIPMSFPFVDYTAGEAFSQSLEGAVISQPATGTGTQGTGTLTATTGAEWYAVNCPGGPGTVFPQFCFDRFNAPIFNWNNTPVNTAHLTSEVALDHQLDPAAILDPYQSTSVNNNSWNAALAVDGNLKNYVGNPNHLSGTAVVNAYTVGGRTQRNLYKGLFRTFISDPVIAETNWTQTTNPDGVGHNIYALGNPYTSNIDISYIAQEIGGVGDANSISGINAVYKLNDNSYVDNVTGDTTPGMETIANFDDQGPTSGSLEATLVRPMEYFQIKFDNDAPAPLSAIAFNEFEKTFTHTAANDCVGCSFNVNVNDFHQVTFELFNEQTDLVINKFYVSASDNFDAADAHKNEAYSIALNNNNTGFYTLQENADGTINAELSGQKTIINGINATDYVALPVQAVFQNNSGQSEFVLKGSLQNRVYPIETMSFTDGNRFYFHDKQTDEIIEITNGFEYAFTASETVEDRFVIYWNGLPETLGTEDTSTIKGETIVYKDVEDFKVRFSKTWNSADIYVYNVAGQLIHSAKNVDTSVDYLIPLRSTQSSAYIVKTIGDNGEEVTKKIIKK